LLRYFNDAFYTNRYGKLTYKRSSSLHINITVFTILK